MGMYLVRDRDDAVGERRHRRRNPDRPVLAGVAVDGETAGVVTHAGPVLAPPPGRRITYAGVVKPALDRIAALLLLAFLSIVLAATAVAVLIDIGRPILYRQPRIGLGGKPFTMLKFRTMIDDRRSCSATFVGEDRRRSHKTRHDPRVTPVGRFLRRWSLDELPQLWNVVRGEMSLVGPRPEMATIVARYEPWQHRRHDVKPGVTGLWQVTARDLPMHEQTELDLRYIERMSCRTDLSIIVRTLPAALGRHGRGY